MDIDNIESEIFIVIILLSNLITLWSIDFLKVLNKKNTILLSLILLLSFVISFKSVSIAELIVLIYIALKFIFTKLNFTTYLVSSISFLRDGLFFTFNWIVTSDLPDILLENSLNFRFRILILFSQLFLLMLECLLFNYIYKKYQLSKIYNSINKKYTMISYSSSSFFAVLFTIHHHYTLKYDQPIFVFSLCLMLIGGVLLLYNLYLFSSLYVNKKSNDLLNESLNLLSKNYEELINFKHDYKNILLSIYGILDQGDLENARAYVNDICEYSLKIIDNNYYQQILKINNYSLQSIFITFINKVDFFKDDIEFTFIVEDGDYSIDMEMIDIVRCLSIILDNAIESKISKKKFYLNVQISEKENIIKFEVKNSFYSSQSLSQLIQKGYSTKDKHTGRGLYIVNAISSKSKYIDFQIKIENNLFICILTKYCKH